MRHAVFTGLGALEVTEAPTPAPTDREVLIRVEASGVCGTDRSFFAGSRTVTPPIVLGHEYSGTVVECGSAVTSLTPGSRVVVDPNIPCGLCASCRRGAVNLCQRMVTLGITNPGGYAEFSCVPETNAYRIPDALSFEEATFTEPLACAVRAIGRADVQLGDTVAVLGAGPLGLLLTQLARLRGASRTMVSSASAERRALALRLGADVAIDATDPEATHEETMARTHGLGADVVIEASGQSATAQRALSLVRPGGTVLLFGCCPQQDHVSVPPLWAQEREITIRGSFVNPFTHATAVNLLETGRVRVQELISARIGLDELAATLAPHAARGSGRVLVHPSGVAGAA